MPKIYNQYNNPKIFSNAGNSIIKIYKRVTNPDNTIKIIETGTKDIYKEIQEAGEGVTLKEMIENYRNSGEIPQLEIKKPTYQDTTSLPDNSIELQKLKKEWQETHDQLEKTELALLKAQEKFNQEKLKNEQKNSNTPTNNQNNNETT